MASDPHSDVCVCGRQKRTVYLVAAMSNNFKSAQDYRDLENEVIVLRRELASAKAELFRLRNQARRR